MKNLNEDMLCYILTFLDVVTLSRTQRVCRDWSNLIGTSVMEQKLTNDKKKKRFVTNRQLRTAVEKYLDSKSNYCSSTTQKNQEHYTNALEEIACTYGWPIGKWDVSNVVDFSRIFCRCGTFNEDLSAWDVSKGTSMCSMFRGASSFDRDLSPWDVSGVTNMSHMFADATVFNQDLARWDTSSVTNTRHMFRNAVGFDQNLSSWDASKAQQTDGMFAHSVSQRQDVQNTVHYGSGSVLASGSHESEQEPLPTESGFLTPSLIHDKRSEKARERIVLKSKNMISNTKSKK